MGGSGQGGGISGILHVGGSGSGSGSVGGGGGSDTLTTSDAMVLIDGTERDGVGVVSWVRLERARKG